MEKILNEFKEIKGGFLCLRCKAIIRDEKRSMYRTPHESAMLQAVYHRCGK